MPSSSQYRSADTPDAVRGLGLQFSLPDGELWRTAMINLPVFPFRTPEAFYEQLLAFSRKHPLAPRVIEVNSLLANLERSLLRLLGEDISVQCHFDRSKDGMHTKVDPGQFTQIILNLVVNARDAAFNRLLFE
jgi:hypothetical protein